MSAGRGLGIDIDEVQYLTTLIPVERGFNWTLSDCFFGNEELNRKPVRELVNAVNKHEGLQEISLRIEGLIKARSSHASGLYIMDSDYTVHNAMMKTSRGLPVTQFDMDDSDYQGGLKIDVLTIQGADRIRMSMDMLIEDGLMEWKGSLKDTYYAYLHPEVLEYNDEEMWKKVAENAIPDLFQFDTAVLIGGYQWRH